MVRVGEEAYVSRMPRLAPPGPSRLHSSFEVSGGNEGRYHAAPSRRQVGLAETSPSRVRRRGGEALGRLGGTLGAAGRQPGDTGIPVLPSLEQGDTRPATPWGPKAGVGRPQPRRVRALPAGQRGGAGRGVARPRRVETPQLQDQRLQMFVRPPERRALRGRGGHRQVGSRAGHRGGRDPGARAAADPPEPVGVPRACPGGQEAGWAVWRGCGQECGQEWPSPGRGACVAPSGR